MSLTPIWGVLPSPGDTPLAEVLPVWRFRLLNRFTRRFVLPIDTSGFDQMSLMLKRLIERLRPLGYEVLDANLWFDGGKQTGTPYHNDFWYTAALENRVLQLWSPLLCWGSQEEIARSMVRLHPEPLPDGWACPTNHGELTQIWTGESRELPVQEPIREDVPGVLGGVTLQEGDVLYFDNAYCHYTLPSRAQRVGLAIRLSCGAPTYNGYFDEPRPLDGVTVSELTRRSIKAVLGSPAPGDQVSSQRFLNRWSLVGGRKQRAIGLLQRTLLLFDGRFHLNPVWERFIDGLVQGLPQLEL